MTMVTGVVEILSSKPAGSGTVYNIKVNGEWFGHGFQKPIFEKGDNISFEYSQKGQYKNVVARTVQVLGGGQQQQAQAPAQRGGGGAPAPSKPNDTQMAIQYQASRNSAIETVNILITHSAVPLPTKKADQYEAVMSLIDDITNQFYVKTSKVVENGGVFIEELEQAMGSPDEDF